ncbi:barstar family protein [Candidatus Galacturonibacter soehngenii]|uniref:Barstar family protein n=1 Tax=Candidatus Galacturonatibacter soehngenii TaxID=2307010 RepID=A0A7V7UBX0_9FIRM|nr:barstar family protein [Candidatus Galacturonibacter soehngenii]
MVQNIILVIIIQHLINSNKRRQNNLTNKVIYIKKINNDSFTEGLNIILDGKKIKTKDNFLEVIEEKLQFPYPCNGSLDSFLDWMRDLSWINSKKINLIIYDYKEFLNDNLEVKEIILDCFEEDILPYWEEDVKTTMVDGETKEFNVYLVL